MRTIPKRLAAVLLALTLLCTALPAAHAALQSGVGYRVEGVVDSEARTLTVTVRVHDLKALGGRFALGFDPDLLTLPEGGSLNAVIRRGERIQLTGEGRTADELLNQERGHVMFAWYPYGAAADATGSDYLVATIPFGIRDGVTEADFNSRTLYLYSVADGYLGWDTSAWVRGAGLVDYSNCVAGVALCDVHFDYPGCDRAPSGLRDVVVTARDSSGSPLPGGQVLLENTVQPSDASGSAHFQMPDGTYTCLVTAPGYEEQAATVEVSGGSVYRTVQLKSLQQLVDGVAGALAIGFQGDDTADHVTRDMVFPTSGEQNTVITWQSSEPNVVSAYGNVFRIDRGVNVTVTATVEKDGKTAQKEFQLTITAKSVPQTDVDEGKPDGQEPETPVYDTPFTDLAGVQSWAGEAIGALYEMGAVNGATATTFAPGSPVSRGEYLTLLMRLFQPKGSPGPGFADVPEGSYYHDAIALAQGLGIAQGVTADTYSPGGSITRQDMMTLTFRALEVLGAPLNAQGGGEMLAMYPDGDTVAEYARDAMGAMLMASYVNGRNGLLAPNEKTTRAEAAVFLYRIYQNALG